VRSGDNSRLTPGWTRAVAPRRVERGPPVSFLGDPQGVEGPGDTGGDSGRRPGRTVAAAGVGTSYIHAAGTSSKRPATGNKTDFRIPSRKILEPPAAQGGSSVRRARG